ncbi:uncharacterized protein LOC143279474 [Babylonia areolata]|uniref:uncharacterized protein LOC143279474 n=1 Tax=Babylonia areolata TaxID=304850 RepID=UPI003FD3CE2F
MRPLIVLALVLAVEVVAPIPGLTEQQDTCQDFNFIALQRNLDRLVTVIESVFQTFKSTHKSLESSDRLLDQAVKNRHQIEEELANANESVTSFSGNTLDILHHQTEIRGGQSHIIDFIVSSHEATREVIAEFGRELNKDVDIVEKNQDRILNQIEQGKTKAEKGIESLINNEEDTVAQLKEVQQALADSAEASAAGQHEVLRIVRESGDSIQESLGTVIENQGSIQEKLDESQTTVEKSIDRLLNNQEVIKNRNKESESSLKSDLADLIQNQKESETQFREAVQAIVHDISDIQEGESDTRAILETCGSKCEISKSLGKIAHIQNNLEEIESKLLERIGETVASESKTQDRVNDSVNSVLKEVDDDGKEAVDNLLILKDDLTNFLTETNKAISDLVEDYKAIKSTQTSNKAKVNEILAALNMIPLGTGLSQSKDSQH